MASQANTSAENEIAASAVAAAAAKAGGAQKGRKKKTKKKTKLALAYRKSENFSGWYSEVIYRSGLIDEYDIGGCYVLRPWSYAIWEQIQSFFDSEIKKLGIKNCYFPMFVRRANLEREADHIEGFSPEVAWVTKSGSSELSEHIAIRPTSETIMYPAFARWVQSHRDLPIRLNQWTNVVRWEFKQPTPFLRTREFLWQEGHTAFATPEEADKEVFEILDLYARVYEELLAVPVIKGRKSEKEKFDGGRFTTTVEAFIPGSGRAIQGATSHSLGQNFSKMFGITYTGKDSKEKHVWQNSWGITTRTIGVCVMVHGDDIGLVLPPRIAPVQVILIGIWDKDEGNKKAVQARLDDACARLCAAGVRAECDHREDKLPGWKWNHWEQKGVPLRIDLGKSEFQNESFTVVRRDLDRKDEGKKTTVTMDTLASEVPKLLETMQGDMLRRARKERDENISIVTEWGEFLEALDKGNLVLAPWCEDRETEEWVKKESGAALVDKEAARQAELSKEDDMKEQGFTKPALTAAAKSLCVPFNQPPMPEGQKCFTELGRLQGKLATKWCLWGRSY